MAAVEPQKKGRAALIGLGLIFLGPLVLAWTLYGAGIWRPTGQVNHGVLLDPPATVPEVSLELVSGGRTDEEFLRRRWTMLYLTRNGCDPACLDTLANMRQVRLSLGRYADRIERVLLVDGPAPQASVAELLESEHPGLLIPMASGDNSRELVGMLVEAGAAGSIYVIDPLGNLLLSYASDVEAADLKEDLKRLLRLSRIG